MLIKQCIELLVMLYQKHKRINVEMVPVIYIWYFIDLSNCNIEEDVPQ